MTLLKKRDVDKFVKGMTKAAGTKLAADVGEVHKEMNKRAVEAFEKRNNNQ